MDIFGPSWPNYPWYLQDHLCHHWHQPYHLSWCQSIELCITHLAKIAQFQFLPYFPPFHQMDLLGALYMSRWTFNHARATFHGIWKWLMEEKKMLKFLTIILTVFRWYSMLKAEVQSLIRRGCAYPSQILRDNSNSVLTWKKE